MATIDPTTLQALAQMAVAKHKYGDRLDSARRSRTDKLDKYGTQAANAGSIAKMIPALAGGMGMASEMGMFDSSAPAPATPLTTRPGQFGTVGGTPGTGPAPKSLLSHPDEMGFGDYASPDMTLEEMMRQLRPDPEDVEAARWSNFRRAADVSRAARGGQ